MLFKDKAIRRLEKEKEEAQTALALLRSEKESSPKVDIISVYQLAKQHDELTNKMADQGLFFAHITYTYQTQGDLTPRNGLSKLNGFFNQDFSANFKELS